MMHGDRYAKFATRGQRVILGVMGAIFVIAAPIQVVSAPLENRGPALLLVALLEFILGLFMTLRCTLCGLEVYSGYVRVVNPLRTIRIPKGDIVRFSSGGELKGVRIELRDGQVIPVWGLAPRLAWGSSDISYELNWLSRYLNETPSAN